MATTTAHLHLQGQLLDALCATLVAAGTGAGRAVYLDHADDLTAAMLPALLVRAGDEVVDTQGLSVRGALQVRQWRVDVTAVCAGTTAAHEARQLAAQVESALFATDAAARLGGAAQGLALTGSRPVLNGTASELVAELTQTWLITYATAAGSPGSSA